MDRELARRADIGPAERVALRIAVRALDVAEREALVDQVGVLSRTYLELRLAAGLSVKTHPGVSDDPFDRLAAAIAAGRSRDTEDSFPGD